MAIRVRPPRPARTVSLSAPGAISSFIRTGIALDNRVVLLQRGGGEAFCPRFRYFVFAPQFFDPLETAF